MVNASDFKIYLDRWVLIPDGDAIVTHSGDFSRLSGMASQAC
jgi:hypothetical protein